VISLLGALTYAELGAMKPDAGGLYVYLRDAFGPLAAFLYGWASFAVIASGTVAALAVAFSGYFARLVPLGVVPPQVISVLVVVIFALVNIAGTRSGSLVQNLGTFAKAGGLILLSALLIATGSLTTAFTDDAAPAPASARR
jgi:APA family basic amino acid/polyamine antiporter